MLNQLYTILGKIVRTQGTGQYGMIWIYTYDDICLPIRKGTLVSDVEVNSILHKWQFIEVISNNGFVSLSQVIPVDSKYVSKQQAKHRANKTQARIDAQEAKTAVVL